MLAAYKALVSLSRYTFFYFYAFLTMPKVPPSRRNRSQNSTAKRRARATRVEQESLEIGFRYKRYKEKNL